MPRHSALAALLAICTSVAAQAQAPFAGQPTQPPYGAPSLDPGPQPLAAVPATSREVEFMLQAARTNLAEIAAGHLGMQRGNDLSVRQYAQRLVQEHTVLQARLQEIAQARGIALPQLPSRHQRYVLDGLKPLSGETFDLAFLDRVGLDMHAEAIRMYRLLTQVKGVRPDLRTYALEALPILQVHLDLAQTVYALRLQDARPRS